ncbi:MAG: RnfABCDGE type electron transport complex subunit B [Proteobacteria bacterium]|nr:RnfABCDGE type electron transport complex subunit B [Pseudomonadota bacterium]
MANHVIAKIREAECIGCTKCIKACPVDAILGSRQLMHTVIAKECIGCKLCVAPCPVDCIDLISIPEPLHDKTIAKKRVIIRKQRLKQQHEESLQQHQNALDLKKEQEKNSVAAKQAYIQEAIARAKMKKMTPPP